MTLKTSQKQQFYSEMAKLLEAGFGIREAADVMAGTGLPAAQAALLEQMQQGLRAGNSIADSLAGNPATAANLERNIIGAGERGGRLPAAIRHLADYFGMLAAAHRQALRGLIHPIIVLHLGVFIGTVPTAMATENTGSAQTLGAFLATLLAVYAAVGLIFIGLRALLRAARENEEIDRVICRLPLVGKARTATAMAAFCKVYHTCLLAGIPMRETVRMAADASQSGLIRAAGIRLAQTVAQGNPLGPQIAAQPAFPEAFARSYATGEAAGSLDTDLANWAKLFQTEAETGVRTLANVAPRILYFLVLVFVGWKIVAFYQSYYDSLLNQLK